MDPPSGEIIFLSGPSSSGKTTSTRKLAEQGWMRIEADLERPLIEIRVIKQEHLEKLSRASNHRPRYSHATHNERLAKYVNLDKVYRKCPSFRPLQSFVADY